MRSTVLAIAVVALGWLVRPGAWAQEESGFVPLFDGKTLNGFVGDPQLWRVEDGQIVGSTDGKRIRHNSFLATRKKFRNFILKVKFKLRNHNSGIQFRSQLLPNYVVRGYQADIAERRYMGILYEERGRGILADVDPEKVKQFYKPGQWNQYTIVAQGPRIRLYLNGHLTVDYVEEDPKRGAQEGIIAFQLHTGPAMEVRFKDILIKELP